MNYIFGYDRDQIRIQSMEEYIEWDNEAMDGVSILLFANIIYEQPTRGTDIAQRKPFYDLLNTKLC